MIGCLGNYQAECIQTIDKKFLLAFTRSPHASGINPDSPSVSEIVDVLPREMAKRNEYIILWMNPKKHKWLG